MTDKITTTDLSDFGNIELEEAGKLLTAMIDNGLPEDFEDSEVVIVFNIMSGNVFLTNSEFQVAMFNSDKLESFYTCPYCGEEGFKDEINHGPQDSACTVFLNELGVATGDEPVDTEKEGG